MADNTSWEEEGRINQKRRTRVAVLEAAKQLLREGQLPSVADAADAARVSRATAYRYFPTQEYLLSEAALESAKTDINHLLERAAPSNDPAVRLDTLVQALQQVTLGQEAQAGSGLAGHPSSFCLPLFAHPLLLDEPGRAVVQHSPAQTAPDQRLL
jgi:AcrR family transcriptional regulator